MLTSACETDQRLDTARITCECSEKPPLGLGRRLGLLLSAERTPRTGKTFVDSQSRIQSGNRSAARFVQEQNVKRSGDLPGYFRRNCYEGVGPEFLATGPQITRRDCVRDPHVDA
jgi:hypothetical protein